MEHKSTRSAGFTPYDWLGYGADVNHFQAGGGGIAAGARRRETFIGASGRGALPQVLAHPRGGGHDARGGVHVLAGLQRLDDLA